VQYIIVLFPEFLSTDKNYYIKKALGFKPSTTAPNMSMFSRMYASRMKYPASSVAPINNIQEPITTLWHINQDFMITLLCIVKTAPCLFSMKI